MSDIDEIKSRLNIVEVINERVPLKRAGRNFKALCPFHAEKTPSFIVSPERQTFKCFGCGKGGSVFDFVMLYDHVDFVEALETLAERAGVKLERRAPDTEEGKLKEKIYEVNHLASEFFHYLLTKHPLGDKARLYIKGRGISDKSIKTFTLGYSPNSWEGLAKYLRKKGYDEQLLKTAGLVIRGGRGFYDCFRGRVMFALKDYRGRVVGFAGRLLDPEAKDPSTSSGPAPKYINTSETPVYVKSRVLYGLDVTREAIQKENEAVVMEGEFDVISSLQAGIPNVVAIKGSALTDDHCRLLRRFTERLTFALDSDLAGDAAARRGIEIAERAGFDMRVVKLPTGKDPDEAARQSPGLLKRAIKEAVPIYDYFLSSALSRYDRGTAFGKKKVADELLPIVAKIENPVVVGHYTRELARALDVSETTVIEGVEKTRRGLTPVKTEREELPGKPPLSRQEKLELYLLSLLLQGKTIELFDDLQETLPPPHFSYLPVRRILTSLEVFLKDHPVFLIKDFADSLAQELVATLDEAFLWDMADILTQEERVQREWDKTTRELRRLNLRAKIREVTAKLRQPEGEDKENQLKEEIKRFSEELKHLEKEAEI